MPCVGEQISRSRPGQGRRAAADGADHGPGRSGPYAYLRGATDTLAMLAAVADDSGKCPETRVVGYGQYVATGETFPQDG